MEKIKRIFTSVVHIILPTEENENVPYLLRKEFIFVLFVFICTLFYFNQNNLNIIRGLNLTGEVYPAVLADLTNKDRTVAGVSELTWNDTLAEAAKEKANDMLKNNYFAHTSPLGITPWFWLVQKNYIFSYAGENLAIDFANSSNVENAWLNSPTHKANIVSDKFSEIGIAAVDGILQGVKTTVVVEFFGKPATHSNLKIAATQTKIPTTKTKTLNNSPQVAGASIDNSNTASQLKIIEQTDKFISVQNLNVVIPPQGEGSILLNQNKSISTPPWYKRFIVAPSDTIRTIYDIILGLIFVAIVLMLSKEYERHHTKHVVMGTMLMAFIGIFLYFI